MVGGARLDVEVAWHTIHHDETRHLAASVVLPQTVEPGRQPNVEDMCDTAV